MRRRSPAQPPTHAPLLLGALGLLLACPGKQPETRRPRELPEGRAAGCIDTPFLGPDAHTSNRGIDCTPRESRTSGVLLIRGKVVAEALAGLPGQGLAGMLVSIHEAEGLVSPTRLPATLAETESGPQGDFSISLLLAPGEYLIVVRPSVDAPAVTLQRIWIGHEESGGANLLLTVPVDPKLREQAEQSERARREPSEAAPVEPEPVEPEPAPAPASEGPKPPPPRLFEPE